jgi:hypothetical protein
MFTRKRKPKYASGQKVRIANPEKIQQKLDADHKLNGLLFMQQMWQYCGTEVIIKKIVRQFEYKKILSAKMPIYMLHGITCDGNSELLEKPCDLNCHLMWHEDWLESR